jgi:hypothetical protein
MEMNFKGIDCEKIDWINLAKDRITWKYLVNNIIFSRSTLHNEVNIHAEVPLKKSHG